MTFGVYIWSDTVASANYFIINGLFHMAVPGALSVAGVWNTVFINLSDYQYIMV